MPTAPDISPKAHKVYKDHNLRLNAHASPENRGAFTATNGITLRAGQTLGPLLMATAVATLGLTGAYLAAALATATLLTFIR